MSLALISFMARDTLPPPMMTYLRACEWSAGPYLARCLTEGMVLEPGDRVFFLMEGAHPAAFCTLSRQDCIDDPARFPWIGFVYVDPAFRGRRLSGRLIGHALEEAHRQGFREVWLATDEVGFYEKYGFVYVENCVDILARTAGFTSYPLRRQHENPDYRGLGHGQNHPGPPALRANGHTLYRLRQLSVGRR